MTRAGRAPAPGRDADDAKATRLLNELGLTVNEARVYLALLRFKSPTAAEAATGADGPRPKVYEALQALEGRGFSKSIGGRVRRFIPVEPESARCGHAGQRPGSVGARLDDPRANLIRYTNGSGPDRGRGAAPPPGA